MNYAYVAYNKRSATTGKALWEALKAKAIGGYVWRHTLDTPKQQAKLFFRWGNSLSATPAGAIELNTREAVQRAANKLEMAKILSKTEGVKFPKVVFFGNGERIPEGNWFIRNGNDQVRYRGAVQPGDKYATQEIAKVREFRVHVFNNEILGVYEKIPNNPGDKILKAENCDFKRLDLANREITNRIKDVRPMAKTAVKALGLLYGGVDVIMDANNGVFVLEVNSSPALNGPNIDRWIEAIQTYLHNPQRVVEPAPAVRDRAEEARERRQREAEAEARRLEELRVERRNRTIQRLNALAQEEGFELVIQDLRVRQ